MSDEELCCYYHRALYASLGSQLEDMYDLGYDMADIKECEEYEKYLVEKCDVLVNSTGTGTLGRTAQYKNELKNVTVDSHVTIVRPAEQIYPAFLGYALQYRQPNIEALAEGSTGQTELSRMRLGEEITIPDFNIAEQMRIADTLSALDARIDTNKQINHNLEEQAKAIFKSWFVDFEPFKDGKFVDSEFGKIPEGWQIGKLSDIANVTMGQSPKGDTYNEEAQGTVFYQGRAEFSDRFPQRRLFTTDPKRMAVTGDVLLSVRAPVGDMNIANENCCIGRGLAAIHAKNDSNRRILVWLTHLVVENLEIAKKLPKIRGLKLAKF